MAERRGGMIPSCMDCQASECNDCTPEKAARAQKRAKDAEDRARRLAKREGTRRHRFEKSCGGVR